MPDAEQAQEATSTATTTTRSAGAQEMLLEFLRDHDAHCPVCGYNLRALTRPICPECRQALVLTVGATRLRLGWLFVALAPGFFSGIAACFVLIPTLGIFFEDGILIPPLAGVVLFGWCSGLFAIILAVKRNRFITRSRTRQRWFALTIWLIHIAAFVLFILSLDPHI
jgi:predicted nucleic acid-binding Zn ribbon protein